ncbi:putative protease prtS [Hyaloscypha variabilis F]|uniref:Putative protease prtS n=1 Tax=Hyaloscypha variabilis (strain UAMH 11265 / GT02V1 / F) TaxID=1149755 RepID=A0A2J6SDW5_HYAVF|nr:putative protease prtS [Hyaloscypha variabilis F]
MAFENKHTNSHVCFIIPPHLLLEILSRNDVSEDTRAALQNTVHHCSKLKTERNHKHAQLRGHCHGGGVGARSIIPGYVFQDIAASGQASPEQKDRAHANLQISQKIHAERAETEAAAAPTKTEHVIRKIYDSHKTNRLRQKLVYTEGNDLGALKTNESALEVIDFFGKTYEFYQEIFKRDSVDNDNLTLIGNLHYDDIPGPPGMDNAFWNGQEMAFGDGDGEIFGSFTKNIDVIGHELTHGVTQYTANLEYEFQSGALNESMSDVFGSMIKQYFYPTGKQLAKDADWLIGEGIFLPSITNAAALRSMKAPGTAYDNPKIGKDRQGADMDGYQNMPNTDEGDNGGVHINSGIPNRAFYLASVGFGGYSWEKAGRIWYAALTDDKLRDVDSSTAFTTFADLTTQIAKDLFGDEGQAIVKKAWTDVKVYKEGKGDL